MMKHLWILALLPLSAAASEPRFPAAGTYAYVGQLEVTQKQRVEVVHAINAEGAQRRRQLEAEGHVCEAAPRGDFRCTRFESTKDAKIDVAERVERILRGATLNLGVRERDPQPLRRGDDVEEWLLRQPAEFLGRKYRDFRYLITQGLHKLHLGDPAEAAFVVATDGSLRYVTQVTATRSEEVFYVYQVSVPFPRQE